MKRILVLFLLFIMTASEISAQTIRQKDRWGESLYYLDGNVLKIKNRWGAPVYYFEGIPEKWVIASIIL